MEDVKPLTDIPAINRFLSYCRVRTVPSKTVLIHAGDLPDVLYYIVRGSVEVMIEDEDGNEMVLAYLNKGQFFGEMGLFSDSGQRSAWVRTRTVTGRVAHAIMDLCNEPDAMTHPQGMQIKVSRQELSRLVGCSREMAGRVLKVLEEQGLLTAHGKTIVVFGARPKAKPRPAMVAVAKAGAA